MKKVLASHLIRASTKCAHGGLFLVDVETGKYKKLFDWDEDIELVGRAGDRGLRGISVYKNKIYVASAKSILIFDNKFKLINRLKNGYLGACHETMVFNDKLYIVSTGFDSLIVFDLTKDEFEYGLLVRGKNAKKFNCNKPNQIKKNETIHLNSVCNFAGSVFFSGTHTRSLLKIEKDMKISRKLGIPAGTHNCYIINKREIIKNDTQGNRIVLTNHGGKVLKSVAIKRVPCKKTEVGESVARQPFARGLVYDSKYVVGGSSPAMVSVYDRKTLTNIRDIIMSDDIRMSIHGIAIWE